MKKPPILSLCLCALLVLPVAASSKRAQRAPTQKNTSPHYYVPTGQPLSMDRALGPGGIVRPAQMFATSDTTWLAEYDFDGPLIAPEDQGWISQDATVQTDLYFHVADATELDGGSFGSLLPLEGSQSMWCGIAPGDPAYCDYATLPGYGPFWDVALVSDFVKGSFATLSYKIMYDTEPGYDQVFVDYDTGDGNWTATTVNGGFGYYDGSGTAVDTFTTAIPDSVRFRFRFTSNDAWDDKDGSLNTDGAFLLDSVIVKSDFDSLYEDFEDETPGDTDADHWRVDWMPGFGDFASLYPGFTVLQETRCALSWDHMWTFFTGSTEDYACGGHPEQLAVPKMNLRGQYMTNEVWSPMISLLAAEGASVVLQFDVYVDLPLDNLVFYSYNVRSLVAGCLGSWRPLIIGSGDFDDWVTETIEITPWIDPGASDIQISLGVVDMCELWCGLKGTGSCHSHAPMFDNVKVGRVKTTGPQWTVFDGHLFQDNFPEDGTTTGTARADMAMDIAPSDSWTILPGDSLVVTCSDIEYTIAPDPSSGSGSAVYCYVSVLPQGQPGKTGPDMEAPETRPSTGKRYPWVGQESHDGVDWHVFRMDTVFAGESPLSNQYCFDLNDWVFTPGDTVQFFFAANNVLGQRTFWSEFTGTVDALSRVALEPMEFQVLPGGGWLNGGDILYVDDFDGRGAQPYFDWAFRSMHIHDRVDRYDVRAPSSNVGNGFDTRVKNLASQLMDCYKTIIYNSGDLSSGTLGDGGALAGGSGPGKSNECLLLHQFLEYHPDNPGLYLSGDDVAEELAGITGADAAYLKEALGYTLSGSDHVVAGFPITPLITGEPGGIFDHVLAGPDTMYVYGGCFAINDFDVLTPIYDATLEMTYEGTANGAVIASAFSNFQLTTARTVLSGFSYHYSRDDRFVGLMDRDDHLRDILTYFLHIIDQPIFSPPPEVWVNKLFQNYCNPFNPTTVIRYSIKERSRVTLTVYNVAGQMVKTLVDDVLSPEMVQPVEWDGRNDRGQSVASGVYFYRLVTKGYTETKKMVLLK